MKNLLKIISTTLMISVVTLGLISCSNDKTTKQDQSEIKQIYSQYVIYAQAEGKTPLSYEEWLVSIKGEKGDNGVGIEKVEYDTNGNLVITFTNGTKQMVTMPEKETEKHTYGNWTAFTEDDLSCEEKLFFRVCSTCNDVQWKKGTQDDHDWNEKYSYDKDYHWYECGICNSIKNKAEHILDNSGYCTVCDNPISATVGVSYNISADNNYAEVVGYEGTAKRIVVSDEYNGLPVKKIADNAFYNNKNITAVFLPDSVTIIDNNAFYGCSKLVDIEIGNNLLSIGSYAFYNCSKLTNISIPNTVTSIGYWAFFGCNSLTDIYLYDNVTTVGKYAFYDCYNIKTAVISKSVTSISEYMFYNCNSLTSIVIGKDITSIGVYTFYNCSSLTSVYYCGTTESWLEISIDNLGNEYLNNATRYYYSESRPTESGNYWRYVNGVPTAW